MVKTGRLDRWSLQHLQALIDSYRTQTNEKTYRLHLALAAEYGYPVMSKDSMRRALEKYRYNKTPKGTAPDADNPSPSGKDSDKPHKSKTPKMPGTEARDLVVARADENILTVSSGIDSERRQIYGAAKKLLKDAIADGTPMEQAAFLRECRQILAEADRKLGVGAPNVTVNLVQVRQETMTEVLRDIHGMLCETCRNRIADEAAKELDGLDPAKEVKQDVRQWH